MLILKHMYSFESQTFQHESGEAREQSPEDFINSLKIFDSYVAVTPEMASQPEYKMTFNKNEQELAEGIRGMLERLAADAMDSGLNVTINALFDRIDEAILASSEALEDDIRDELLLVATKMRYNLQVRFQKETEGSSLVGYEYEHGEDVTNPYAGIGLLFRDMPHYSTFNKPTHEESEAKFDQPLQEDPPVEVNRDYTSEAQRLIYEQTDGREFSQLDRKEQGRVVRRLARDLHPDVHGDNDDYDPELYKAVTALTAQEKEE